MEVHFLHTHDVGRPIGIGTLDADMNNLPCNLCYVNLLSDRMNQKILHWKEEESLGERWLSKVEMIMMMRNRLPRLTLEMANVKKRQRVFVSHFPHFFCSNFWPFLRPFFGFFANNGFFSSSDQRVSTGHYSFRNEELPRDFRLKENSFQMTTFIFDDIAAKTEERLNLVRMDTDKATEESKEALEKVRRRFFDDILFPKLIVKAIRYLIYYQRFTFL